MTKIDSRGDAYSFDLNAEQEEGKKKDKEKFSIETPSGRKNLAGNMLSLDLITEDQYDRLVATKNATEFTKLCKEFDVTI